MLSFGRSGSKIVLLRRGARAGKWAGACMYRAGFIAGDFSAVSHRGRVGGWRGMEPLRASVLGWSCMGVLVSVAGDFSTNAQNDIRKGCFIRVRYVRLPSPLATSWSALAKNSHLRTVFTALRAAASRQCDCHVARCAPRNDKAVRVYAWG